MRGGEQVGPFSSLELPVTTLGFPISPLSLTLYLWNSLGSPLLGQWD
jgi:hypothetical protein